MEHEQFLENLDLSERNRWRVARAMVAWGYAVTVGPMFKAPTKDDAKKYADHGDLYLSQRLEAKGRTLDFTCCEDFPYPDAIVCACRVFDEARPKPVAFMFVNQAGTHLGCVLVRQTQEKWTTRNTLDRSRGYRTDCYYCPKELIEFRPLPEE